MPPTNLRWVTLIRSEPDLSWDKVVEGARRRELVLIVRNLLGYLDERFSIGVPERIIRELDTYPVTNRERRDYRLRVSPPGIAAGIEEVRYVRNRYVARRSTSSTVQSRRSFPAYIRHVLGAESLPHVGGYAVSEILRRVP